MCEKIELWDVCEREARASVVPYMQEAERTLRARSTSCMPCIAKRCKAASRRRWTRLAASTADSALVCLCILCRQFNFQNNPIILGWFMKKNVEKNSKKLTKKSIVFTLINLINIHTCLYLLKSCVFIKHIRLNRQNPIPGLKKNSVYKYVLFSAKFG